MASGVRLLQAAFQILAYVLDQRGMFLQKVGDPLQGGVQVDTMSLQWEIDRRN